MFIGLFLWDILYYFYKIKIFYVYFCVIFLLLVLFLFWPQYLYRQFKAILNKITPQKFSTLVQQALELKINTEERMKGVTDLIFEQVKGDFLSVCYCYEFHSSYRVYLDELCHSEFSWHRNYVFNSEFKV